MMLLHGDPLGDSMFWVGAMFAFVPMIIGASVVAVWWRWHRREHAPPGVEHHDSGPV